jgi:hypothetical protein
MHGVHLYTTYTPLWCYFKHTSTSVFTAKSHSVKNAQLSGQKIWWAMIIKREIWGPSPLTINCSSTKLCPIKSQVTETLWQQTSKPHLNIYTQVWGYDQNWS